MVIFLQELKYTRSREMGVGSGRKEAESATCTTLVWVVGWYKVKMWGTCSFFPLALRKREMGREEELGEGSYYKLGKRTAWGWSSSSGTSSGEAMARSSWAPMEGTLGAPPWLGVEEREEGEGVSWWLAWVRKVGLTGATCRHEAAMSQLKCQAGYHIFRLLVRRSRN